VSRSGSGRCRSAWRSGRPRAGFSLIEVLLVLALLGAVSSAAIWLFIKNSRFYDRSDETIGARENLRATIDLLAAEVRQASPADFLAAASDSLTIRFDVSRAIVCDSTAPDQVALVVFDTVRAANVPSTFRGTAVSDPYDSSFTFLDGWRLPVIGKGSGPRAACEARGASAELPSSRFRVVSGWRSRYGKLPPAGTFVRVYGRLSYRLGTSSFAPGLGVWRNGQELASPFAEGSSFSYILEGGEEQSAVPVGDLGRIRAVHIRLEATGRSGGARFQPPVRLPAEHLVFPRN
jgi:prepilin-type N-terminal cleavage/methylation domain-containing protein